MSHPTLSDCWWEILKRDPPHHQLQTPTAQNLAAPRKRSSSIRLSSEAEDCESAEFEAWFWESVLDCAQNAGAGILSHCCKLGISRHRDS